MKKQAKVIQTVALLALFLGLSGYYVKSDIKNVMRYGLGDWPSHEAISEKCPWKKRLFEKAGITAFVGNCIDSLALDPIDGYAMIFTDADKQISGKWVTNDNYEFTINVYDKSPSSEPIDVVGEWYSKLSPDQKEKCEIQNADEPVQYFQDGRLMITEDPHPTQHKSRYKIEVKSAIMEKSHSNRDSGSESHYICGRVVGSTLGGHTPYFEFDDRSPSKYILVGTYGVEGPLIDLNSVRF